MTTDATTNTVTAAAQQRLFDDLVRRRGGLAALSALNIEVATMISALMVASRSADASEMVKTADVISRLTQMLPPETDEPPADLTRLTDQQLAALTHIMKIAHGETEQDAPEEPPPAEPERGPSELAAIELGRWIDAHHTEWSHRALNSVERDHLRNGYQSVARGFICRNLWFDIFHDQMHDEIERQIRAALAEAGRRDEKVVLTLPAEEPKRLASIHDSPLALLKPNGEYPT
jgi:hypothetical protein